jgi:hypothetical protein
MTAAPRIGGKERRKETWVRHIWSALIAGIFIAGALFGRLSIVWDSKVLFGLQWIGLLACIYLRGLESATTADYLEIAIPINAVLYATIIFVALMAMAKTRNRDRSNTS